MKFRCLPLKSTGSPRCLGAARHACNSAHAVGIVCAAQKLGTIISRHRHAPIRQTREMPGDIARIERRAGERADPSAGRPSGLALRARRHRDRAGTPPSRRGTSRRTAAPGPSAPSAHRARRPAPGRAGRRRRGRSGDSWRSIAHRAVGRDLHAAVERAADHLGATRRCGSAPPSIAATSSRLATSSMKAAARACARTSLRQRVGIAPAPSGCGTPAPSRRRAPGFRRRNAG